MCDFHFFGLVRCTKTHLDQSGSFRFDTWRFGDDCALAEVGQGNF